MSLEAQIEDYSEESKRKDGQIEKLRKDIETHVSK